MLSGRCLSCPVCLSICLSVTLAYCGQTTGWIKRKLGTEVGLGPGHIVLDGDPAPVPKTGADPQFLVDVFSGKTASSTKMPIGMEIGLGPDHIVLDGDSAPPRDTAAPNFRPMSVVAKRLDGSRCQSIWM